MQCLKSSISNKPLIKEKAPMGVETIPELKNRGWANIQCKHVYHTSSKCDNEENKKSLFIILVLLIFTM